MEPTYTQDDEQLIDTLLHYEGIGHKLLEKWGGMTGLQQNLDATETVEPKLTARQHQTLAAAFALRYVRDGAGDVVNSPADAYEMAREIENEPQEILMVLCFNTRNKLIKKEIVYRGSVNSSQVRVGELFRPAIVHRAPAIIVVHNHPSGDPTPSPDDVSVTRAIVQAGRILETDVLDHLVVANGKYVSLKERGLGFG
jgi:DNA repair protein RadC